MTNQIRLSPFTRAPFVSHRPTKASILQRDPADTSGVLDGSTEDLNRFLQDLVEMTGQSEEMHDVPVLELQFGDIATVTSVSTVGIYPCLSVTALLPRQKQSEYRPLSSAPISMPDALLRQYEFLWHADDGRYVVVRRVAIEDLTDERSVMDAILDTSDQAAKWFATVCANSDLDR